MKLKILLFTLFCAAATTSWGQTTKVLGGDLSLVPAYEAAGDVWLDADGNSINTTYSDGMITFVKEKAKWNSVRVRLLVDPTQDDGGDNDYLSTCQDIEYVKKLGKRIKDAGMNFLLDIFYSDTWTDVSQQWIPTSWGYDRTTATTTVAAKVKSYTTEVLNTLTAYGAKPDYVQIGNEVSYGMLWDNLTNKNKNTWFFNNSSGYDSQKTKIDRFAALLKAAAEGVRASNASTAKIILHNERTSNGTQVVNFYTWVEQAGFTDYDVIGLSYYPLWHGYVSTLKGVLTNLNASFPNKKIQIVETGYHHTTPYSFNSSDFNTSSTWAYSPAGQAAFLADLIDMLNGFDNVDGLYYWQPEECGNGAGDVSGETKNRVMTHWDNRGFWNISWESGDHALDSKDALMTMMKFIGETPDEEQSSETDVTDSFQNMDFENGESNLIWTVDRNLGWDTNNNPWPTTNEGASNLTNNYIIKSYASKASNLSAGNIIYQSASNMPAGEYTVTAAVHTDYDGIYLFANDDQTKVTATSDCGTAYTVSVTTTLTEAGTLTIGLTLPEKPTSTSEVNLYADNFKVTYTATGVSNITVDEAKAKDNRWYNLSGQRVNEPKTKGVYIHNGKKVAIK